MELFTTEVQSHFFKILTAESQEAVDTGKEGFIRGFKVGRNAAIITSCLTPFATVNIQVCCEPGLEGQI